jgi:hypothetical protein
MTTTERAAQLWALLAFAAHNRQVLTYDIVGRLIGVPRQGLGRLLEPIQSYCLLHELPPLTILVVSETTGAPGTGFVADTENIGLVQLRVFAFDWLNHTAPTAEDFERALQDRPSNGVQQLEVRQQRTNCDIVRDTPLSVFNSWVDDLNAQGIVDPDKIDLTRGTLTDCWELVKQRLIELGAHGRPFLLVLPDADHTIFDIDKMDHEGATERLRAMG